MDGVEACKVTCILESTLGFSSGYPESLRERIWIAYKATLQCWFDVVATCEILSSSQ
jgi:hypothetical protein